MHLQILIPVVEELSALLTNARVERVYQGREGGLYIILSRARRKFILLLSPDRAMPRLHLVTMKAPTDDSPNGFTLYLRSHLSGARVASIGLLNQDRIVEIRFMNQENGYLLFFEPFGASVNLILADSSSKILSVYYPVTPAERVARSLLPGLPYVLPDKPHSPGSEDNGFPRELSLDRSPNRSVELCYERLIGQRRILSLRDSLSSLIKKKLAKTARLVSALTGDIQSTERTEAYRQQGDLILANLKHLRTGMEAAELTGYDGKTITVTLDPKHSPSRNAELYFKKYKKSKKGRDVIAARLHQAREDASYLESLLSRLGQTDDAAELVEIQTELDAKGYGGPKGKVKRKMQPGPASTAIRKYTYNGWEILVGKSAAGNDHLTMKIARPDDLWLHAEGMPGSHVLVKNPNAGDIPPEVLMKAAALAAFHSKGRNAGKVPVTYTRAGLVKKPKGAKPGLVTLRERKSLMVKPEDG